MPPMRLSTLEPPGRAFSETEAFDDRLCMITLSQPEQILTVLSRIKLLS